MDSTLLAVICCASVAVIVIVVYIWRIAYPIISLLFSGIPYISTEYTNDKRRLFHKSLPHVYWSLKSHHLPYIVINKDEQCTRDVMKNCLTKSDDMFMSIRTKDNDPTKFGQLIIPALPESVLTDVPGSQRKRMVNHLAKLDMEKCFEYVISVSTSVGGDMDTHLYIIMVVGSACVHGFG